MKLIKKVFNIVRVIITTVINSVLLFVVYFVGVGLTSLFAKIVNKRFLRLKPSSKVKSYWSDFKASKNKESYYRQF